jgi:hypothetical protein
VATCGKTIPVAWLHILLIQIYPKSTPGGIVWLDLSGESGMNTTLKALFIKHGYLMELASADSSSQNGLRERPNQTFGNAVRVMIYSARLSAKYWEYAFYFFLRIHNVLPHGKNTISPYQMATVHPDDLSCLHIFGCRINALSTTPRGGKVSTDNIIQGRLLGYGGSMKNFILMNDTSGKIFRATHATFDEAQLSAHKGELTPNHLASWGALNCSPGTAPLSTIEVVTPPVYFCILAAESPFLTLDMIPIVIACTYVDLGLVLQTNPMYFRNIIVDVHEHSSATNLDWTWQLQFHTIMQVEKKPVFTVAEVMSTLANLDASANVHVTMLVAHYHPDSKAQDSSLPQIVIDQLRIVHHILHG